MTTPRKTKAKKQSAKKTAPKKAGIKKAAAKRAMKKAAPRAIGKRLGPEEGTLHVVLASRTCQERCDDCGAICTSSRFHIIRHVCAHGHRWST